jgi:soluble lytic murein transglycosylase
MRICRWLLLALPLAVLAPSADGGQASLVPPPAALHAAAKSFEAGDSAGAAETLRTLDSANIPAAIRTDVDLLLGIALLRERRSEEAAAHLDAARAHPLLSDYALYALAKARRQTNRPDLSAEALRRLAVREPQSVLRDRAAREIPRDLLVAGQPSQAEDAARKYLAAVPSNAGQAEVSLTLGETLLLAGRSAEADAVFRGIWLDLPASPEAQRAQELLTAIPTSRPFTEEERFRRAARLHQLERHALAIPELTPFADAGSSRENLARLMLGIGAFNVRQYEQAAQWLEPLKDAPDPNRIEALFWLGRSWGRAGDAGRFAEYLTQVADAGPPTRRSEEALYLLAQSAKDNADLVRSRAYLGRLLKEHPNGPHADVAMWLQGWLAYKQKSFSGAAVSWRRLAKEESGSRWRVPALYWRGRALEAMKAEAEAIQAYRALLAASPEHHYYRLQANLRLAALTKKATALHRRPPQATPPTPAAQGLHARKARALRALGLTDEAVEEWVEHVRSHPDEHAGLTEACRAFLDLKRYDRAVWVGSRIVRPRHARSGGTLPMSDSWKCRYPLGYIESVRRHASHRALDPYLVLALIRQESGFSPNLVSRAGARGLMQMMSETAERTAQEYGLRPAHAGMLETPEVNIQFGVYHLADLLQEYGGNLTLTLAAYNAGKEPVQRWLQRYGFADEVEFVEDIPYAETRDYVKRVLANYDRYTNLYAAQGTDGSQTGDGRSRTAE